MRYRLVLAHLLWVPFATSVLAQPVLDMPLEIDWGTVAPNADLANVTKMRRDLTIRNAGNQPLRIYEVRPSCGCTTAPLDTNLLGPGEQTTMHVTLNLPSANGPIKKYVTIRTNAGPDSVKLLSLSANVQRPLQLEASYFAFNQAEVGKPTVAELQLTSYLDNDVMVSADSLPSGMAILGDQPLVLKKGVRTTLRVQYLPTAVGPFNPVSIFRTTVPGYERITVQGFGLASAVSSKTQR